MTVFTFSPLPLPGTPASPLVGFPLSLFLLGYPNATLRCFPRSLRVSANLETDHDLSVTGPGKSRNFRMNMQSASSHFIPALCHNNIFCRLFLTNSYTTDSTSSCSTLLVVWNLPAPQVLGLKILYLAPRVRDSPPNLISSTTI